MNARRRIAAASRRCGPFCSAPPSFRVPFLPATGQRRALNRPRAPPCGAPELAVKLLTISRMRQIVEVVADALLATVLGAPCASCGEPLEHPTASPVCGRCWQGISRFAPPLCPRCGDPLLSWRAERGMLCGRCERRPAGIARGRAVGEYEGPLRAILHAFKYQRRSGLARPLGALMVAHGGWVLDGADCAVPVPLHWRRRWRRGFNQSALLASHLGLPVVPALRRTRHTATQADLPADARAANVRRAFTLRHPHAVAGRLVVLVDDVSTTGATLEACAQVLIEGGAREVRALTAARVVTRPPAAPRR